MTRSEPSPEVEHKREMPRPGGSAAELSAHPASTIGRGLRPWASRHFASTSIAAYLVVAGAGAVLAALLAANPIRDAIVVLALLGLAFALVAPVEQVVLAGLFTLPLPLAALGVDGFSSRLLPIITQTTVVLVLALILAVRVAKERCVPRLPRSAMGPFALLLAGLVWSVVTTMGNQGIQPVVLVTVVAAAGWLFFCATLLRGSVIPAVKVAAVSLALLAVTDTLGLLTGLQLLPAGHTPRVRSFGSDVEVARFVGSLGDYELLAELMGTASLLLVWLALRSASRAERALWITLLVPVAFDLIATGTRSVIFLLAPAMVVLLLITVPRVRLSWRVVIACATGLVGVTAAAVLAGEANVFRRLFSIDINGSLADAANRSSVWVPFTGRSDFRSGFLLGNGLPFRFDVVGTYPHSLYLFAIYTVGILGLALFAAGVTWIIVELFKAARGLRDSPARLQLVVASFVLLDQIKIEVLRLPQTSWFGWSLLGLGLASVLPGSSNVTRRRVTLSPSRKSDASGIVA